MPNFLIDEDTDLLAAEFVLGTLDSEERANAQLLLRMDHGFIAMVRIWERRFGELHLMVEPVEPDAQIAQRIKAKIAELPPREPGPGGPAPGAPMPAGLAVGVLAPESPAPGSPAPGSPAPGSSAPGSPAVGSQAPEGKPLADGQVVVPEAMGAPADTETPNLADAAMGAQTPKPDAAVGAAIPTPEADPANGTTPKPPEATVAAEAAEAPPAVVSGTAAVAEMPGPESSQVAIPASPPLPVASARPSDAASVPGRRPERADAVSRSRGRWRVLGIVMSVLVAGLAVMLAAWRFAPDRVPAQLRPAELMRSFGIQTTAPSGPVFKPAAPPESQFDE